MSLDDALVVSELIPYRSGNEEVIEERCTI